MPRKKSLLLVVSLGVCSSLALVAADTKTPHANLTAAQIVEKHVAARGGLQTWRAVQAMSWTGKLDAGGGSVDRSRKYIENSGKSHASKVELTANEDVVTNSDADKQVHLPFLVEMKRPSKSRVEIEFAGKTAVQVYDGTNGWKVRPYLNRNDVQPFTAEEAKSEVGRGGLDGPLVDYEAKGSKVELDGVEPIKGHDAYKLKLTTKDGEVKRIWIDTESFLDVKVEGIPRMMDGRIRTVWIYQGDFRSVQGVMIPFVLETAVEGYPNTHKMVIEKVEVNPKLDDALFAKPTV
jgi:outer membrane lipoprotein-sorting protein